MLIAERLKNQGLILKRDYDFRSERCFKGPERQATAVYATDDHILSEYRNIGVNELDQSTD